jgi:transcription antitermination factor NusG
MFPGYLFLRQALNKAAYLELRQIRGLVRVLGGRRDWPAVIADEEIDDLKKVAASRRPRYAHLREPG